jgi:hypothetical protein
MCNLDIRTEVERAGLYLWQIAYALKMHDSNFARKLRTELSTEEKTKIRTVIAQLVAERGNADE